MSKLSRFKKAPAVKLPSKLTASRAQRNRFDDDSEDDDDFVKRPEKQSTLSLRSTKAFSTSTKDKVTTAAHESLPTTSISEYFTAEQPEGRSQKESSNALQIKREGDGVKVKASVKSSKRKEPKEEIEIVQASCKSRPAKKNETKVTVIEKEDTQSSSSSTASSESTAVDESSKVFCPFCMKKLGDKLTGTTHVKTCAKNLPLEQVYEAIQLQEKQMKEWEKLGLVYPGFASTSNTKKPKGGGTSGRGRGGRNKNKPADSDLELAIALSVSLHEEVESRTTKENQFIIENGLQNEIELVKVVPGCSSSENNNFQKEARQLRSKVEMPAPAPVVPTKRRGKKIPVGDLPLYTVNPERQKEIIGHRVAKILDDCENSEMEKFYVRDEVPKDIIGVPKRLIPLLNKNGDDCQDSSLWKLAESEPETPDESFSVLEVRGLDALEPSFSCTTNDDIRKQVEENETPSSDFEYLSVASNQPWIPNKTMDAHSAKAEVPGPSRVIKQSSTTRKDASLETKSCRSKIKVSKTVQHLPPVIQDIASMLLNRVECDIVLYGREEKPIKCHRFILSARCPKILDEVIVEENAQKVTRSVIPLISYSHKAVWAFLWYLYTGSFDESDEKLCIEVEEIANMYNVEIIKTTSEKTFTKPIHEHCSVEIQTDCISTEDISTMTEEFSSATDSPLKRVTFNATINGVNTSCEDLFKTYDYDAASPSRSSPTATTVTALVDKPPFRGSDADNSDDNKSVDLFEDLDDDGWEDDYANKPQTSFAKPMEHRKSENFTCKEKLRQKQSVFEDEDYLRDLETPISSFVRDSIVSQKKRSRCVSPVLDDSGNMYTATQIAEILQTRRDGGDVIDCMNKAIKKQKLDFSENELNWCNNDNSSDNELGQLSLVEHHSFIGTSDCLNKRSVHQSTPKLNSSVKSIRKTVSTPNLSTKSPNGVSPFYNHQMQNEFEADDPFADDSLFAHIPDEAFSLKSNSSKFSPRRSRTAMEPATSQLSRTPSRSRKLSPRNLISEDDLSLTENGQNRMKGQQKRKGKPTAPKIKLPSRRAPNKVNISQPPPVAQSVAIDDGKSPMLNYSLIDTPILKEELRRYGIKPLPRSKAKVLLRHIYKETHK